MTSSFSGINLALQALLSHQQTIEVIEHNVANANTPGYRRQEAVLAAGVPYPASEVQRGSMAGQMGTGVRVDQIRRFNIEFFDARFRKETAETKRWETQANVLQQVEATLAETSSDGLTARMDAFWSGWQALSGDPNSPALRADLQERARGLIEGFHWRANSLQKLQQDQNLAVQQRVEEINHLAGQVARLNREIGRVQAAGDAPNDLLDNRDLMLDRLAEISGAVIQVEANGEALVSIGGHSLVFGETVNRVAVTRDTNNLAKVIWEKTASANPDETVLMQRGELKGLLEARDIVIPNQLAALNTLAQTLVTEVNDLHRTGRGLAPGDPGNRNFFAVYPGGTVNFAQDIRLDNSVDEADELDNIAAAAAADSPGDGQIAGKLADLKAVTLNIGGIQTTLNGYYTGKVAELGLDVKGASSRAKDRQVVVDSLAAMRESATGVNLDEEAANLMKSQRAYQAAVRMMTVIDEMLDLVINGMGVVGR